MNKNKRKQIAFWVTPRQNAELCELAGLLQLTKSETLRTLVSSALPVVKERPGKILVLEDHHEPDCTLVRLSKVLEELWGVE